MPTDLAALEARVAGFPQEIEAALAQAQDAASVERVRTTYLGRQGALQALFKALPQLPIADRPRVGTQLNRLKTRWTAALEARLATLRQRPVAAMDRTMPGHPPLIGHRHPVTQVIDDILGVFERLGFTVVEGPEVETPFYNFEALNIPPEHPSRETFDTFFLKNREGGERGEEYLLRSHTSPMQVRYLEQHRPPFRIVVPGRVYRPDAVDCSHCFQFHQIEGLVVESEVTFADLKGLLTAFARAVFGPETRMRFRPHFFPFTEPSAEVDIGCIFCRGLGCRVCGQKGWLEILGAGLVHPRVFEAAGARDKALRGLAFGLGVERIAMLKFGIDDIRLFFENDVRFLRQF